MGDINKRSLQQWSLIGHEFSFNFCYYYYYYFVEHRSILNKTKNWRLSAELL
jgi:hypothetical protein